jgi:polar amino acid transport system permease protein
MLESLPFDPVQAAKFSVILLRGAGMTVQITAGALVVAVVLGLFMAILKTSRVRVARILVDVYIEIFRDVPALTLLFILYFGFAYMGLRIQPVPAAIIGLGFVGGAILTEVFRSGFEALHHGQREAALAVGMTPMMAMRYVILPQAVRITAIAAPEIMFWARNLVTSTFQTTLIYVLAAILYFCMSFPLAQVVNRLEERRRSWQ